MSKKIKVKSFFDLPKKEKEKIITQAAIESSDEQAEWEKRFTEDFKRKDWTSPQWMKSNDALDRLIWMISSFSPHNLWKAKEAIRDFVKKNEKEIVICAAIKTKDGVVIRGHRHADAIYTAMRMRYKETDLSYADQGFVTSRNRYVGRSEGREIQDAAGIPSASPEGYMRGTLFSEDLY